MSDRLSLYKGDELDSTYLREWKSMYSGDASWLRYQGSTTITVDNVMNMLAVDALLQEVAGGNQEWMDHISEDADDKIAPVENLYSGTPAMAPVRA